MVVFIMADDYFVDIGYGWSMIIIMNLHFLVVVLWMMYLTKEFLRVLCRRHTAPWKVWLVRKYGWRIGKELHKKMNVDVTTRHVPQMMQLEINKDTDNFTLELQR